MTEKQKGNGIGSILRPNEFFRRENRLCGDADLGHGRPNVRHRISVGELADHAKGLGKLGIRPEDLRPVAESGENTIDGEVVAVEPLGGFTIVDIHAGEGLLKMRLPSQVRFAERELVHLGLDASKTRLFDVRYPGLS